MSLFLFRLFFFRNQPFLNLQTGQLALLSTLELLALIVGSLVSGYLKNTISIKQLYIRFGRHQLLLLVGFATVHFGLILLFSSLDAFIAGLLSPRLQELVFKQILRSQWERFNPLLVLLRLSYQSIHNRFRNDCYKFWDLSGQLYSIAITLTAFVMLLNIREHLVGTLIYFDRLASPVFFLIWRFVTYPSQHPTLSKFVNHRVFSIVEI